MDKKSPPCIPDWVPILILSIGISIAFNNQMNQVKKEVWTELNHLAEILEIQSEQMTKHFEQDLQFREIEVEFWQDYYQSH